MRKEAAETLVVMKFIICGYGVHQLFLLFFSYDIFMNIRNRGCHARLPQFSQLLNPESPAVISLSIIPLRVKYAIKKAF